MMPQLLRYLLTMPWGAAAALAAYLCLRPWRRKRLMGRGLASPALREAATAANPPQADREIPLPRAGIQ